MRTARSGAEICPGADRRRSAIVRITAPVGVIEIELAGGTRLRITGAVNAETVSAAVGALAAKERR
jgi:hypothetical protein